MLRPFHLCGPLELEVGLPSWTFSFSTEHPTSWEPLSSVQLSPVTQSCLTLCDPMDCSTPGFPVSCQVPELAQTHVH